jgi:predicted RNA-binding Zn-ribbon protein involved in translation (DUF1610 family)
MKKILMNSDIETARYDQLNDCWISRHGKRFSTELPARMHGCTHFYCQSCGVLTNKEKTITMFVCRECSEEPLSRLEDDPNQSVS